MRPYAILAGALFFATSTSSAQSSPSPSATAVTPPSTAPMPPRHRNKSMMISGIVFTSLASATLLGGLGVIIYYQTKCSDICGALGTGLIGLPLAAGSTLFAGIGVPLWVIGAQAPATAATAPMSAWVPGVSISPQSVSLGWKF